MRILFKSTFQFNLVMPDKILIDKMSPAPYFTLLGGRGVGGGGGLDSMNVVMMHCIWFEPTLKHFHIIV